MCLKRIQLHQRRPINIYQTIKFKLIPTHLTFNNRKSFIRELIKHTCIACRDIIIMKKDMNKEKKLHFSPINIKMNK